MDFYFYLDRDSPLHRLDGRTQLALLASTCALAMAMQDAARLLPLLFLVLCHLCLARSLSNLFRVWRFLALVTAMTTALWAASGRGATPLFLWVKWEGVWMGAAAAVRIDTFILAGLALLSTARNEELLRALVRLRLPYAACFAFSTALRLAPSFVGLGVAVREAQRARGLEPDAGSPLKRLRQSVPVLVPAFLSTLRMTGQLAMSLESRGFGFSPRRTFLSERTPGWRDAAALALVAGIVAAFWASP